MCIVIRQRVLDLALTRSMQQGKSRENLPTLSRLEDVNTPESSYTTQLWSLLTRRPLRRLMGMKFTPRKWQAMWLRLCKGKLNFIRHILLRPITTGAGSAMNQSQFLAIICNSLDVREKSSVHGAIGFGYDSHWLKNWRNHVITFRQSFENCAKIKEQNGMKLHWYHLLSIVSLLSLEHMMIRGQQS